MTFFTAFLIGLAVTVAAGFIALPLLRRLKAGQPIREDGPKSHQAKAGTPTVGGVMFIVGIGAAILITGANRIVSGDWTLVVIFVFALIFAAIGFMDDYAKLKKKKNLGLSASQKFLLQIAVAVAFVLLLRLTGNLTPNLYIPFINVTLKLPEPVYLVFAAFVIIAEVNAVNLTDGADGLATGVTLPIAAFCVAIAAVWGAAYTSVGIFAAALCGALVAFLFFNFHPAKVIMGDTGSHFLGAAVCAMAFAFDMPLILITLGIVYLIENLSDVIQVVYYKKTKGRRVFKMAPIHHHFELSGWSEYKLFFVFSGVSALFALISYLAVKGRFG